MLFTTLALAATCLSFTSAAPPAPLHRRNEGYYRIVNNCATRVWYNKVGEQGVLIEDGYIEPGTTTYGSYGADNDGVSVKLSWKQNSPTPYQFETTVDRATNQVFYDLSAINGDGFKDYDNGVWPLDRSGPTVWCPAGTSDCAYLYPDDNSKTHAASLSAVLEMAICAPRS